MSHLVLLTNLLIFAVGLCIGSFLNVVIARVPKGESIVRPRSRCPRCKKPIAGYDNIPVLSWLILRGKCRNCGLPISARYPLVEILCAVLVFAVWTQFGPSGAFVGYAAFVCALLALTYIDLDTWLLPHQITWPLLALGLVSPLWNAELTWFDSGVGAAIGFGVFALIALLGEKLLKKETMGWGDVWLLGGIGAWLGWRDVLPVIFLSALQGAVVGILLMLVGRGPAEKARAAAAAKATSGELAHKPVDEDDWVPPPHAVPFGPFLALAAVEMLLVGDTLLRGYLSTLQRL